MILMGATGPVVDRLERSCHQLLVVARPVLLALWQKVDSACDSVCQLTRGPLVDRQFPPNIARVSNIVGFFLKVGSGTMVEVISAQARRLTIATPASLLIISRHFCAVRCVWPDGIQGSHR